MKNYDVVIIGGGISGIYSMYNLKKKYPKLKVLLLEKNNRFGGRVYTFHTKVVNIDYTMDLGAGRIGFHHKNMVSLINELNLEKNIIPIKNTENYKEVERKQNNYSVSDKSKLKEKCGKLLYKFFNSKIVTNIPKIILKKLYLNELLSSFFEKKDYNNIKDSFEYNNKLYSLNAFDAINVFKTDYNQYSKFFILKNGFSSIINKMIERIIQNKNYKLKKNTFVSNIEYNYEDNNYIISYSNNLHNNNAKNSKNSKNSKNKTKKKYENHEIMISCNHLICALPRCNLIKFKIMKPFLRELNTINEITKVRIFEIYDKSDNEIWFNNISKTTTNEHLQFVIPINRESGLIMSSYNENPTIQDNYWYKLYKKNENKMRELLRQKLSNVFNIDVPKSKYMKLAYWKMGVACWKKNVDSYIISQKILNLMPNFYICGENYSQYQAWCEGALISSQQVFQKLDCELKLNKICK
tara:strand:+ start:116 stop:1516 length:1401 start_codon:yes stop_codon:yes gene_type:complete